MRLLQVVHQFLPDYVGGTEVYVADLAKRLQSRGHEVVIFAGGPERATRVWDGIQVEMVPGGVRGPAGPARTFLTTFGNRGTEQAFSALLGRFMPDVVHFHHLLGLSGRLIKLTRVAEIPCAYTLHDYWFMCPKTQLIDHRGQVCGGPRYGVNCGLCASEKLGSPVAVAGAPVFTLRERRVKRAIASADLILAPSEFMARMATQHGLPVDKVRTVQFGLDTEHVAQAPSPARMGLLRVTYLGAIEWSKGLHVLANAVGRLDGRVAVAAYGDPNAYPEYARQLPATMLKGSASRDSVPDILATSDVLVVPSLWYENSPMVIAEAHAAGVPVIASDLGALPEKVGDGGLLFPPGDAAALASALRRLVQELGLLDRLRDNVKRQVRPSRADHVDEVEAIYRELAGRG